MVLVIVGGLVTAFVAGVHWSYPLAHFLLWGGVSAFTFGYQNRRWLAARVALLIASSGLVAIVSFRVADVALE